MGRGKEFFFFFSIISLIPHYVHVLKSSDFVVGPEFAL